MNVRRKFAFFPCAALAVALFAAPASAALFSRPATAAPTPALPRVEVAVVKRLTSVSQGITTTSTLQPLEEVIVVPKVTARIDSIHVEKGDRVEAGEPLILLDSRSPAAEYNSIKAQVAVSKAEQAQAKVTLADAKRELDRYTRLRKSGYATQQEFDTRSTTYQAAVAAEAKAAAQVQMAQANLDAQRVTLSEYKLVAPIKGVVLDDYDLVTGTLLSTQSNAMRVGRVDRLKARVDIPERDMRRLKLDMDAQLTFESLPGETCYGTVTKIDPYINTSTRTVGAEITVNNSATGFKMRPGMFARVLLIEVSEENPLAIPAEALRAGNMVMVVRDGRAELRQVKVGMKSGGLVTVSEGLALGDDVVVSGGNNVHDGDEVDFVIVDK